MYFSYLSAESSNRSQKFSVSTGIGLFSLSLSLSLNCYLIEFDLTVAFFVLLKIPVIESKPINAVEQIKRVSVIPGASTLVNVQYMHITKHISHPSTPETLFALTALSAENMSTKKSFIVIVAIVVNRIRSILPLRRQVSLATRTCVFGCPYYSRRRRTS